MPEKHEQVVIPDLSAREYSKDYIESMGWATPNETRSTQQREGRLPRAQIIDQAGNVVVGNLFTLAFENTDNLIRFKSSKSDQ